MKCWLTGKALLLNHPDRTKLPRGRPILFNRAHRSCPVPVTPPRPSSNTEPTKRRRRVLDLDYYVQVYNRLLSERSSQQASCSARHRAPARSTEPFGPLDPATQPLLEIDPGVSAAIRYKRNTNNRLQKLDPGSPESPQYLWSWIVYYINNIPTQ